MRGSTDRLVLARLVGGLLLLILFADLLQGQEPPASNRGEARITYLTASSAYLDAGAEQGLQPGDTVRVVRADTTVALITLTYVSARRSSGSVERKDGDPAVGDRVLFSLSLPRPDLAAQTRDSALPASAPTTPRVRTPPLRGRIGLRYLTVRQRDGGLNYSQPALEFGLQGPLAGGLVVEADVRARRTVSDRADGTVSRVGQYRVYALSLAWTSGRFRVTSGRQFSAPLASVSLFDGVRAEILGRSWSAGLFGGTQPDPLDFGYSTETGELGGYFQWRNAPGASRRWSVTTGIIGSYQSGEINREFGFVQGSFSTRAVSLYLSQEVDYNRGWKAEAGESTISPTSTFASLSLRPSSLINIRGGFDNRRSVRLYRDFVNPETRFDDNYRQGVWGGISLTTRSGYQAGVEARMSSGGGSSTTASYTLSAGVTRLAGTGLSLRSRSTWYRGHPATGWLQAVSLALTPVPAAHVSVNAGWRENDNPLDNPAVTRTGWVGADLELSLQRNLFLLLSANRESGADANDQLYGGVTLRF